MRTLLLTVLCCAFGLAAHAQRPTATTVYSQYFTSYALDSVPPSLTIPKGSVTKSPFGFRSLGPFAGNTSATLTIHDLPPHSKIIIDIGWHIIGPWSGNAGKDKLQITLDGRQIFNETFSNTFESQSFPGVTVGRVYPARTGARNSNMLGFLYDKKGTFKGAMDATYEHVFSRDHSESSATIRITAAAKGTWALEHMVIKIEGEAQPVDIFPVAKQTTRMYDEDIVTFDGKDIRALGTYQQDDDLSGIIAGGPWDGKAHTTLFRSKCNSCGSVCMMYTYIFYADGWVNVWSNREPFGPALFSCTITPKERAEIKRLVTAAFTDASQDSYHAPDIDERTDIEHCDLRLFANGTDRKIYIEGGEPATITALTTKALEILKKYGWYPTPFGGNGE